MIRPGGLRGPAAMPYATRRPAYIDDDELVRRAEAARVRLPGLAAEVRASKLSPALVERGSKKQNEGVERLLGRPYV